MPPEDNYVKVIYLVISIDLYNIYVLPTRNKPRNATSTISIIDSLDTLGNVVTMVAVGEAPNKYLLKVLGIPASLHPYGSFTYFKL